MAIKRTKTDPQTGKNVTELITKKDEVVALYKKKCPFLNQDIKPMQKQQKDDVTRADERLEAQN